VPERTRGKEIERKYLVVGDAWRALAPPELYRQGYLSSVKERTVRVRTTPDAGYITVKGITVGATRAEYEYEIPLEEANEMLDQLAERPIVEKRRHRIPVGDIVFEVDEFLGANAGLIVAEVELSGEDQVFERPSWLGQEVTGDPRYYNVNLAKHPYGTWDDGHEDSGPRSTGSPLRAHSLHEPG
jgi:CYTH domain-containing protein